MANSTRRTYCQAEISSGLHLTGRLPIVPQLELTLHFSHVARFYCRTSQGLQGSLQREVVYYEHSALRKRALQTSPSDEYPSSATTASLLSIHMPQLGEEERARLVDHISRFVRWKAGHVLVGTLRVVVDVSHETAILTVEEAPPEEGAAELTVTAEPTPLEEGDWGDCDGDDGGKCCAVCLEVFVPRERVARLPCLHPFHSACISQWLGVRRSCPVCRLEL